MNCEGCGKCCGMTPYLQMIESDYKRIVKKYPKLDRFFKKIGAWRVVDMRFKGCPFQSKKTGKCLIYGVRPAVCREFPLSFEDRDGVFTKRKKDPSCNLEGNVWISAISCDRIETFTELDYKGCFQVLVGNTMRLGNAGLSGGLEKIREFIAYHEEVLALPHPIDRKIKYWVYRKFKHVLSFAKLLKLLGRWEVDGKIALEFFRGWLPRFDEDEGNVARAVSELTSLMRGNSLNRAPL